MMKCADVYMGGQIRYTCADVQLINEELRITEAGNPLSILPEAALTRAKGNRRDFRYTTDEGSTSVLQVFTKTTGCGCGAAS